VNALDERLGKAFDDEPPVGDAVEDVLHRAEQLRKRRIRKVLLTGLAAVLLVAGAGYGLTSVLLPGAPDPVAAPRVTAVADPIATALTGIAGMAVVPRLPATGAGWRHYSALDAEGSPRGSIEVSVYSVTGSFCLPIQGDKNACALLQHSSDGLEYVRYIWDRDIDWQVNQAVARRVPDGRVIVVVATGERNTRDAETGRPPLTALQTEKAATDPQIMAAFEDSESCNDPATACPSLRIPVPVV
jgi:hypothetical protein